MNVQSNDPAWIASLNAIGQFVGQVGWPLVALFGLWLFRDPIRRLKRFGYKDVQIEIGDELKQAEAGAKAQPGQQSGPTSDEIARAGRVAAIADNADLESIRRAAVDLATEYERVRASMAPGDPRTRRMEGVVAKMRALGRAVFPLRHELMASASPGQRLVAMASMQVSPDYEALDWLVSRLNDEKPFVSYHAAVALLMAARDPLAKSYRDQLREAAHGLTAIERNLPRDSDRMVTLTSFKSAVAALDVPETARDGAPSE